MQAMWCFAHYTCRSVFAPNVSFAFQHAQGHNTVPNDMMQLKCTALLQASFGTWGGGLTP